MTVATGAAPRFPPLGGTVSILTGSCNKFAFSSFLRIKFGVDAFLVAMVE
jgi:hypothetical protein